MNRRHCSTTGNGCGQLRTGQAGAKADTREKAKAAHSHGGHGQDADKTSCSEDAARTWPTRGTRDRGILAICIPLFAGRFSQGDPVRKGLSSGKAQRWHHLEGRAELANAGAWSLRVGQVKLWLLEVYQVSRAALRKDAIACCIFTVRRFRTGLPPPTYVQGWGLCPYLQPLPGEPLLTRGGLAWREARGRGVGDPRPALLGHASGASPRVRVGCPPAAGRPAEHRSSTCGSLASTPCRSPVQVNNYSAPCTRASGGSYRRRNAADFLQRVRPCRNEVKLARASFGNQSFSCRSAPRRDARVGDMR